MSRLRIGEGFSLPLDVVTQTIAALAKRRAGKSYTIAKIVEELFRTGQRMAATIERAKAEDPRELRRQIAELRGELAQAKRAQPAPPTPKSVEVPVLKPSMLDRLEKATSRLQRLMEYQNEIRDRTAQAQQIVVTEVGLIREAIAKASKPRSPLAVGPSPPVPLRREVKTARNPGALRRDIYEGEPNPEDAEKLDGPE